MKLSSQEEYGLRCLLQVALHEQQGPVQTTEIAMREGLSPEYTAKLLRVLRQGDLVVSIRGAGGGYKLARPASEISIWEAIEVLGGEFFTEGFCDCHPGQRRECVHVVDCSVRALWRKVENTLKAALSSISLEDLGRDERTMATWLGLEVMPGTN